MIDSLLETACGPGTNYQDDLGGPVELPDRGALDLVEHCNTSGADECRYRLAHEQMLVMFRKRCRDDLGSFPWGFLTEDHGVSVS